MLLPSDCSRRRYFAIAGLLIFCCAPAAVAKPSRPRCLPPEQLGFHPAALGQIDRVAQQGIEAGQMPGCIVAVGRTDALAWLKAYGHRQVEPELLPMTTDTLFDLASLTKPVATATSVMILAEQGKLGLKDRVGKFLPEFSQRGKEEITVFDLLVHQGGLIADNPLADYAEGPKEAWRRIFQLQPKVPAGTKFIYSDVGYLVLGALIHRVSGQALDAFARDHIFAPLGMSETGFCPAEGLRQRAAATEKRDGQWIRGQVHDPRAFRLGGVAGHAGLFSTAEDLAIYAQMMLGGGQRGGVRVLKRQTVAEMTRGYPVSGGLRGLGWDVRTGYSSNRGKTFSPRAFGHGGFTGTAMWIDPGLDMFVIFLSNRLHPDGIGSVNPLAGQIGTIAADALRRPPGGDPSPPGAQQEADEAADRPHVLAGIDVLLRDGFRLLAGRRVGLITNQTGIDSQGIPTAQRLHEATNLTLVALFSPEHGPQGTLDTAAIPDSRDEATGLPIYSLYGKTRRPTAAMLRGIDTLVFDIQDIGTRFYTYISTMGYAMEAAAEHDIRFVVLDRPNPIGGLQVAGPMRDAGRESFVGYHCLPVRHGMTIGELAQLFRAERKLDLDLQVVEMDGWSRGMWYDQTGLPWVNPSPNMRSLTEALLYPGIGLLETTNLSVGRGTETPFEVLGAPWVDGQRLAMSLRHCDLPGVRFLPIVFTPESSKFASTPCGGIRIVVTNRHAYRPVHTGLQIARQLYTLYPDMWQVERCHVLLGNRQALEALLAGKPVAEIEQLGRAELEAFLKRRARFLLYR